MEVAKLTINTTKVVEDFYAALASKNLERIVNHFSGKVDWFIAGEETLAPWLGQRNSRQEIKSFTSCCGKLMNPFDLRLNTFWLTAILLLPSENYRLQEKESLKI